MQIEIKFDDLLEKYNNIIRFETKTKSHDDEVTDCYDKGFPKVDSNYICLAVISLESAFKKDDSYYLQVFLKECKYIEKKVLRHINENLNDFCSS